jgi:hypothetical protein
MSPSIADDFPAIAAATRTEGGFSEAVRCDPWPTCHTS